jgi:hypothetical protein
MTTIETIQRHYDKLTPGERVSAMFAALARDDMAGYMALGRAAPVGGNYRIKNHHGLLEAFQELGAWHVIMQLGDIVNFYVVMCHAGEVDEVIIRNANGTPAETFSVDNTLRLIVQELLDGREAWHAICKEHNIDPDAALSKLPHVETMQFSELLIAAAARVMEITPDSESALEAYRSIIKGLRANWE